MNRTTKLRELLTKRFEPIFLDIQNESSKHHVPLHAETHFKIVMVAEVFASLSPVARHRLLYKVCQEELEQGLHALSLQLFTPYQWQTRHQQVMPSPNCRGGFEHS